MVRLKRQKIFMIGCWSFAIDKFQFSKVNTNYTESGNRLLFHAKEGCL